MSEDMSQQFYTPPVAVMVDSGHDSLLDPRLFLDDPLDIMADLNLTAASTGSTNGTGFNSGIPIANMVNPSVPANFPMNQLAPVVNMVNPNVPASFPMNQLAPTGNFIHFGAPIMIPMSAFAPVTNAVNPNLPARLHQRKKKRPISAFKIFPQFPGEVQEMIWERACEEQRIISIRLPPNKVSVRDAKPTVHPAFCITPALMMVCRLSAKVAKRIYKKVEFAQGLAFWFQPEFDIVYLKGDATALRLALSDKLALSKVLFLAVDLRFFIKSTGRVDLPDLIDTIEYFPFIEKLFFILGALQQHNGSVFSGMNSPNENGLCFREDIARLQIDRWFSNAAGTTYQVESPTTYHVEDPLKKIQIDRLHPIVDYQVAIRATGWPLGHKEVRKGIRIEKRKPVRVRLPPILILPPGWQ